MKTIFMTIFEGVEAKNLLRTGVVSTLLAEKEIRIVLFTKSQEKVEYYRHEFNDPRLLYEVPAQAPLRGVDRMFASLKFTLLRSKTTSLKRRMQYEISGDIFRYWGGSVLNWCIARPMVRRLVRYLDFLLVKKNEYAPFFEKYRPDCVLLAHLFDEREVDLVREAKKRGIRTIGLINSWDKTTARAMIRLLPDKAIVFNNIVKREMEIHNEMKSEDIFVSGLPQYDIYANATPHSRAEFFLTLGLSAEKKIIVYAPMGRAFSGSDWDVIDLLRSLLSQGKFGNDAALFVRFQPNDFLDEAEIKKRPGLLYDYPGTRFGTKRGVDWDMNAADISRLVDTLTHMSVLVSYASSIVIDAALFGKPSVNIGYEVTKGLRGFSRPTQYYETDHYGAVLRTGAVALVKNEHELVSEIRDALVNPDMRVGGRTRLIAEQCVFTDGKSSERIARFILSHILS